MKQLDNTTDVDLDDMVSSLQATYSEYARRKKQVFRSLVGKLYQSFDQYSDRDSEDWLERKEREHFEKRMKEANEKDEDSELYVQLLFHPHCLNCNLFSSVKPRKWCLSAQRRKRRKLRLKMKLI